MPIIVIDLFELVHVNNKQPGIVLIPALITLFKGPEIDQMGQAVRLRQLGQLRDLLLGLLHLLRKGLGIVFPVQLLQIGHRLVDMHYLPPARFPLIQNGKAAVHIDLERFVLALPPDGDPPVDQAYIRPRRLLLTPKVFELKLKIFSLCNLLAQRIHKFRYIFIEFMSARADNHTLRV